ncbi:hypothetical protein [Achromobacter anxifer]|uniref:hypothetical protein n=1 Tax=Achromobacter anxifer TaxID=1287737 RepID=UPI00158FDEBB|nr:hypothetical protein [Achromobacter anxifer]
MSHKLGARRFFAATASAIRGQGRAMLASAPWSLAAFMLTLPVALMSANLFPYAGWPLLALALVNLIALARMTFAWHRVIGLQGPAGAADARGGTAEARHLALLGLLVLAVAALARATGDLPFLVYVLTNGSGDHLFWIALAAALMLVWLPVLYALALYGQALPRVAATGEYGLRGLRAAAPYPCWPLMLALLLLTALAGYAGYALRTQIYEYPEVGMAQGVLAAVLCMPVLFVVMAMYAVAYRDSAPSRA